MRYPSVVILFILLITGCVNPRPLELQQAEQDLLNVAADESVVRKSPVILEQAAKTYHTAELNWRRTASASSTIPLALLAQEQIAEARLQADLDGALDDAARAKMGHDALLLERRTGLADFTGSATVSKPDAFSSNRIDPSVLNDKTDDSEALEAELFFLPGRAGLSPNGQIALIPIVDYLKVNLNKKLIVEVHTNNLDSDDNDLFLAQEQAESVRNYFIAKGVSPRRVEAQGLISSSIAVPDGSGQTVEKNRAIIFRYLPL